MRYQSFYRLLDKVTRYYPLIFLVAQWHCFDRGCLICKASRQRYNTVSTIGGARQRMVGCNMMHFTRKHFPKRASYLTKCNRPLLARYTLFKKTRRLLPAFCLVAGIDNRQPSHGSWLYRAVLRNAQRRPEDSHKQDEIFIHWMIDFNFSLLPRNTFSFVKLNCVMPFA